MKNRKGFALACFVMLFLPAAAGAVGVSGAYIIGGGDVLEISVWKNPELSTIVTVRPDGMITLPLVDDVRAEGRTPLEFGKWLKEEIGAFVNAPSVTVTVVEARSYKVFTLGAVTEVGTFHLEKPLSVFQLFSLAGGGTERSDLARAFILRRTKMIPVNLIPEQRLLQGLEDVEVRPGDILVVPPRKVGERILVVGEVVSPTAIDFREGMTVLDAFVEAGGGTEFSRLGSVKVIRGEKGTRFNVDLKRVMKGG